MIETFIGSKMFLTFFNVKYDSAYLTTEIWDWFDILSVLEKKSINAGRRLLKHFFIKMCFSVSKMMTFWFHFYVLIVVHFAKCFFLAKYMARNDLERFERKTPEKTSMFQEQAHWIAIPRWNFCSTCSHFFVWSYNILICTVRFSMFFDRSGMLLSPLWFHSGNTSESLSCENEEDVTSSAVLILKKEI